MNNENFTGIIDSEQTLETTKPKWHIDEILAGDSPVNWREKQESEIAKWPVWDQAGTYACVAFSKAKQLSIRVFKETGVWIDFSPASIYQLRANRPELGMGIADANEIVNSRGATLEALMKSQGLTEAEIMAVKRSRVADLIASAIAEAVVSYLYVPVNIDRIAQTIESGKAVSLLIFANSDEYGSQEPVATDANLTYDTAPIRHEVVAVDYFLQNGKKKLRIEDSAHFGGFSVRNFTEEWISKRVRLADAMDLFSFDGSQGQKPSHTFTQTMKLGDKNEEVKALQDILKYESLFPSDQDSTGYYGSITAKAVLAFQQKHSVASDSELLALEGKTAGPKTIAKLNELYS